MKESLNESWDEHLKEAFEGIAQDHAASPWRSWDSNPHFPVSVTVGCLSCFRTRVIPNREKCPAEQKCRGETHIPRHVTWVVSDAGEVGPV